MHFRNIHRGTPGMAALTFLVFAACSEAPKTSGRLVVRDSAGVQIREYPEFSEVGAARWTVSSEPELAIGEISGEEPYLFARIRGAQPLPGGGIAVADGQSSEIRFFDARGRHVRTSGGEGSGPGEFTRLWGMFGYRGDSLAASNAMGRGVSIFSAQGNWGRLAELSTAASGLSGGFIEGALDSGSFLVRAMQQFQTEAPKEGYLRENSTYQIFSPEGVPEPLLRALPDMEIETRTAEDGRLRSYPLEMGRRAASVIVGDEVYLGVTDGLELWMYGAEGQLKSVLRVGIQPVPVDDEIRERFIEFTVSQEEDPEAARRNRQLYRDRIWPDSLPVFSGLEGDSEGNVWVRKFTPPFTHGPSEWWVFGQDGSFKALANLPQGMRVEAIGSDFVLGVMSDDLGIERVFRFGLEKD